MKQKILRRSAMAFLCALVMVVIGSPQASAAGLLEPTITVESTSVSQGGTAYVYIYGHNLESLGALQFTLTYDEFIALNTHMIQKQAKLIESMSARIDELEARIAILEGRT